MEKNTIKNEDINIQEIINKAFIVEHNKKYAQGFINKACEIGLDFKLRKKVIEHKPLEELKNILLEDSPTEGKDLKDVFREYQDKIERYSTNFSSPNFLAFPDSSNAIPGLCGAILGDFLNQNLINSTYCSPAATFVEMTTIKWMRDLIGYNQVENIKNITDTGGIVVSGGVMANTIALMMARERHLPGVKENGLMALKKDIKVIIPMYIDHYSIRASLGWLGLGEKNVLRVKTKKFRIDLEDLKKILKEETTKSLIIALVAYAGDSRSMTIDKFNEIHEILKPYNIWFHIDACHGLQCAFSDELRHLIDGMHHADSVTVDPHKIMFLPYNLSMVLTKDPDSLKAIAGTSDLIMQEEYSFGQITPFLGSKGFWSLKLWFLWKTLGSKNIGRLINERCRLARVFADFIEEDPFLILINAEVNINSVIFLFIPFEKKTFDFSCESNILFINNLNKEIHKNLFTRGDFYLHTFKIPDLSHRYLKTDHFLQPLRYMCGNPTTSENDLKKLIKEIKNIGFSIWKKVLHDMDQQKKEPVSFATL